MEQIIVKTEVQQNGDILLFYVDGDADEDSENHVLQLSEVADFEILERSDDGEATNNDNIIYEVAESQSNQIQQYEWTDEEVQKLLIFYIDNKEAFNESTSSKHLWTVACNTILTNKTVQNCETKLLNLKKNYAQSLLEQKQGYNYEWNLFSYCHQAFFDDKDIKEFLKENGVQLVVEKKLTIPLVHESNSKGTIVVEQVNSDKLVDDKVETMLKLYLRYKSNIQKGTTPKSLWETIAMELGEEGSDYWHKRFLNFKQHYIRMLVKRGTDGPKSVNWRYMDLFDQIFGDDSAFQEKYANNKGNVARESMETSVNEALEWNESECTILAKYYFDCFDEFHDPTIPDNFLWTEVGRLLDKNPEDCKANYEEMKSDHLKKYSTGTYRLSSRIPLEIIFDYIISKEVELYISNPVFVEMRKWTKGDIEHMVHYFYENLELFKDQVCYFVCWAYISKLVKKDLLICKKQWEELKVIYKSILNDKKKNPDVNIDWVYIDIFDRIFDFGMDTNLLKGYEKFKKNTSKKKSKAEVKINTNTDNSVNKKGADNEDSDECSSANTYGDKKVFKLLEYYLKHKDEFVKARNSKNLWSGISERIGLSNEQCAHRLRNLKQVYTSYVEREMNRPDVPILWPYYDRCKKVFGVRATRFKLLKNKEPSKEARDWSTPQILQMLSLVKNNINKLSKSNANESAWSDIAEMIGKSKQAVRDKFLELRKSYRRLKTLKEKNPKYKMRWRYVNQFEEIYGGSNASMLNDDVGMDDSYEDVAEAKGDEDEDFECIIVLPEETVELSDSQMMQENEMSLPALETTETQRKLTKWNKLSKKNLLIFYKNYIKAMKGKEINPKLMWEEIASKLSTKRPHTCRKMFAKLKADHLKMKRSGTNMTESPYYKLMEKILQQKLMYAKKVQTDFDENKIRKDVLLPTEKVELALQYYLQNLEDFLSPKFEKKYLWTEFSDYVSLPMDKLFNKIIYLKQNYCLETNTVAGEDTQFNELLKEIILKENAITADFSEPMNVDENEVTWTEDEVEKLLVWYLANLEKFKNPKFARKYLWLEVSSALRKTPMACSKKMSEIRSQYKTLIKGSPEDLLSWRFNELCQKIYGTGKKSETSVVQLVLDLTE